jgi:hypothetical protein
MPSLPSGDFSEVVGTQLAKIRQASEELLKKAPSTLTVEPLIATTRLDTESEHLGDGPSDSTLGGSKHMRPQDKHKLIGRIYGPVAEIVVEGRQVRLKVAKGLKFESAEWRSLAQAVESLDSDLRSGFELPDERSVGHKIGPDLDDDALNAIQTSLHCLTPADVRVQRVKATEIGGDGKIRHRRST